VPGFLLERFYLQLLKMIMKLSSFHFKYGFAAGAIYCMSIAVLFLAKKYSGLWIVYVGNAFFFATILYALYILRNSQKSATTGKLLAEGLKIIVLGILLSCIVIFIFLLSFNHENRFNKGNAVISEYGGIAFMLYVNNILVNALFGFFGAFIIAITSPRSQRNAEKNNKEK
jgi:chromate transport protein ChrA